MNHEKHESNAMRCVFGDTPHFRVFRVFRGSYLSLES